VRLPKTDFTLAESQTKDEQTLNGRIPINYGNQPSIQTSFVFNHIDQPWLTQYWTREIIEKVYSQLSPHQGYYGDEDQGLMGSLAVLMKMGLFEMKSGAEINPQVEIGSPIFKKITIHLNKDFYEGDQFTIKVLNNSSDNRYIQQAKLNEEVLVGPFLSHRDITKGGELLLQMGNEPNKGWK